MLQQRFGLFPGRSPLLGESLVFSLPAGTKMFQFPALASLPCVRIIVLQTIGLSHSEIPGSMVICTYPRLIAAYHVLRRLREPRHPPCALFFFRIHTSKHDTCGTTARHTHRHRSYFQLLITIFYLYLQSCLCQYVKELCENPRHASCRVQDWLRLSYLTTWRITDSNR